MAPVEQRLAYLEAKVNEQAEEITTVRQALVHLENRMDARFDRMDARFDSLDTRYDTRLTAMDTKMSWLVGIVTTACVAQLGTMAAVIVALITQR